MRYRLLSVVLAVALTAACSDTPESDPFAPVTASVTACQVNTVRQAAGRYFESGADGRTANDLVKALQQAPDLGSTTQDRRDAQRHGHEGDERDQDAGLTRQAGREGTGVGEPREADEQAGRGRHRVLRDEPAQRTRPVARAMASRRESSVSVNTHSPATVGVETPASVSSQMRQTPSSRM